MNIINYAATPTIKSSLPQPIRHVGYDTSEEALWPVYGDLSAQMKSLFEDFNRLNSLLDNVRLPFNSEMIDSSAAAEKYPNHYSLITVDKEMGLGVTFGKLLCMSKSLDGLNKFISDRDDLDNINLSIVAGLNILDELY